MTDSRRAVAGEAGERGMMMTIRIEGTLREIRRAKGIIQEYFNVQDISEPYDSDSDPAHCCIDIEATHLPMPRLKDYLQADQAYQAHLKNPVTYTHEEVVRMFETLDSEAGQE